MSEIAVTESDMGKTFDARQGDTIRIRLPENASTPYHWELDPLDGQLVECVEDGFSPPAELAIGAGGTRVFLLQTKSAGKAEVRLRHKDRYSHEVDRHFHITASIKAD